MSLARNAYAIGHTGKRQPDSLSECAYVAIPLRLGKKATGSFCLATNASILRFIEDNWNLGRIGAGSYDVLAGTLNNMFDFNRPAFPRYLILYPSTGQSADSNFENNNAQ